MTNQLSALRTSEVRFSEVDSMNMVWHGNYLHYFEDGRDEFACHYGISYLYFSEQGYKLPIVHLDIRFKAPLQYRDKILIETTYTDSPAAKLIFNYRLTDTERKKEYCTGTTVQVFLDRNNILQLTIPPFFAEWKKKWLTH